MDAFVRLADGATFSAVAEQLRVKQSTVSKWIAALEGELGSTLLERTTRHHRPTDAGAQFAARAVEILRAYASATEALAEQSTELVGTLRVSAPVVFGRRFVAPLVARWLVEHPKVSLELVYSDRYVGLVDEAFDVAIRVGQARDTSARARKLGETGRRLVGSPGYVAANGGLKVPRDLAKHECLVHSGFDAATVWRFTRAGRVHRCTVEGRIRANNSEALVEMTRAGLGISLLASWLVDAEIERGSLVPLLPTYVPPRAPIHALYSGRRGQSGRLGPAPKVRSFIDALAEHLRSSLPSEPKRRRSKARS